MIFAVFSAVLFNDGMNPMLVAPYADNTALHLAATALQIGWWLFAARTLTVLLGTLMMQRVGHTGRLLQDLMGAVVFEVTFGGSAIRPVVRHDLAAGGFEVVVTQRAAGGAGLQAENEGEHGGYKEVIARVEGDNVYGKLKFESGAHRVQRVPATESQGRIHTSACTVAVLPEPDEQEAIEINPADLRVDTYRSSGAGGQHVNKTDSAIRITHLPSGIVVECQEERSQHKNRARAMSWLSAKLNDQQTSAAANAIASERKLLVGSGDRSERIRTYNFAQGRVTDHRVNLTLYSLDEILAGGVDAVIEPLLAEYQADQLAAIGE